MNLIRSKLSLSVASVILTISFNSIANASKFDNYSLQTGAGSLVINSSIEEPLFPPQKESLILFPEMENFIKNSEQEYQDALNLGEYDLYDAYLSDYVYSKEGAPRGWERIDDYSGDVPDFYAAVFQNKETKKIVVAFRGTVFSDLDNVVDSFSGSFIFTKQDKEAINYVSNFLEKNKHLDPKDFDFTGHSKGGRLAIIAGGKFGGNVVTANPQQINKIKESNLPFLNKIKIKNYIVNNELLDKANKTAQVIIGSDIGENIYLKELDPLYEDNFWISKPLEHLTNFNAEKASKSLENHRIKYVPYQIKNITSKAEAKITNLSAFGAMMDYAKEEGYVKVTHDDVYFSNFKELPSGFKEKLRLYALDFYPDYKDYDDEYIFRHLYWMISSNKFKNLGFTYYKDDPLKTLVSNGFTSATLDKIKMDNPLKSNSNYENTYLPDIAHTSDLLSDPFRKPDLYGTNHKKDDICLFSRSSCAFTNHPKKEPEKTKQPEISENKPEITDKKKVEPEVKKEPDVAVKDTKKETVNDHYSSDSGSSSGQNNSSTTQPTTPPKTVDQEQLRRNALAKLETELLHLQSGVESTKASVMQLDQDYIAAQAKVKNDIKNQQITNETIANAHKANELGQKYFSAKRKLFILQKNYDFKELEKLLYDKKADGDYSKFAEVLKQTDNSYKAAKIALTKQYENKEKTLPNKYNPVFNIANLEKDLKPTTPDIDPIPLFGDYQYAKITRDKGNFNINDINYSIYTNKDDITSGTRTEKMPRGYAEYQGKIIGDKYKNGKRQLTAAYEGDIKIHANFNETISLSPIEMKFVVRDRNNQREIINYQASNFDSPPPPLDKPHDSVLDLYDNYKILYLDYNSNNDTGTGKLTTHNRNEKLEYSDGIARHTSLFAEFVGPTGEEFVGSINIADIEPGYDMYGGMMGKRTITPPQPTLKPMIKDYDYQDLGTWGGIQLNNHLNDAFYTGKYLQRDIINGTPIDNLPKIGTADYNGTASMKFVKGELATSNQNISSNFYVSVDFSDQTVNPRLLGLDNSNQKDEIPVKVREVIKEMINESYYLDFGEFPIESFNGIAGFKGNGSTYNGNDTKIVGSFSGPRVEQTSGLFEIDDKNNSNKIQGYFFGRKVE